MSVAALHTAELIEKAATTWQDKPFLVEAHATLSFSKTLANVRAFAAGLIERDVSPGDRVAIWAPNRWEWVVSALAVQYIGGTVVTLNTRYRGREAAQVIRLSGARMVITVSDFLGTHYPALLENEDCGDLKAIVTIDGTERTDWQGLLQAGQTALSNPTGTVAQKLESARARVTGESVSDILFTSGTTGIPKGVITQHAQNLQAFSAFADILGLNASDRYLIINPFFHSFGYKAGWLACLLVGAEAHPVAVFDTQEVIKTIAERQITCMPGPPTLFHSLINHRGLKMEDIRSLTKVTTGASVIPTQLIESMWQTLGIETVITAYGLSESCGLATMCRQGDSAETIATTSGRAVPGVEVGIMDSKGAFLPAGEIGEIVIRGFNVMQGYLDQDQATREVIDQDGWLHTGDVGAIDEGGNLSITDRLKDMFISGGFNCYPAEIEQQLLDFPGISQAAVVGIMDERLGEVGAAFLVASDNCVPNDSALLDWCRLEMANYKVPRVIRWVESLPLNAAGKVMKTELREML